MSVSPDQFSISPAASISPPSSSASPTMEAVIKDRRMALAAAVAAAEHSVFKASPPPTEVTIKQSPSPPLDDEEGGSGDYVCPVCGYRTNDKHCFHYGGVSCYSCRAFFRRAHQTTKTPVFKCKKDNNCDITVKTRRKCQSCRYNRCLRAGMDPALVLSDEQKKIRFRNYLKKKQAAGGNSNNSNSNPMMGNSVNQPRRQQHNSMEDERSSSGSRGSSLADDAWGYQESHQSQEAKPGIHVRSLEELLDIQRRNQHHQQQFEEEDYDNSSRAHIFGRSINEASYLPVIAIMAKQRQQQQQQYYDQHYVQHQHQHHESKYFNSLSAHATILARRDQEMRRQEEMAHAQKPREEEMLNQRKRMYHSADFYQQPPKKQLCARQDQNDDDGMTRKIEFVQRQYLLAMGEVDSEPAFIGHLQNLYEKVDPVPTPLELCGHAFRVARQFRAFALSLPGFTALNKSDQNALLFSNSILYFVYIVARTAGAANGDDQLEWILGSNQPQNLSGKALDKIGFADFVTKTGLINTDELATNIAVFEDAIGVICGTGAVQVHTGLIAQLLLFLSDPETVLEDRSRVQASFAEALFHLQRGCGVGAEEVLSIVRATRTFAASFKKLVKWDAAVDQDSITKIPFLDFGMAGTAAEEAWLRQEVGWFSSAAMDVPLNSRLANFVVDAASINVNKIDLDAAADLTSLLKTRSRRMVELMATEVGNLVEKSQAEASIFAFLVASLARSKSLVGQMRVLVGTTEDEAKDQGSFCGVDLNGIDPVPLTKMGIVVEDAELNEKLASLAEKMDKIVGNDGVAIKQMLSIVCFAQGDHEDLKATKLEREQILRRRMQLALKKDVSHNQLEDLVADVSALASKLH